MKKDRKNSTLIVLGAGASIGAKRYPIEGNWRESISKLPSSQHFFADLFHVGETDTNSEHYVDMLGPMYEGTYNFIQLAWGLRKGTSWESPGDWKNVNIEDVFTFLDVGERMHNKRTGYHLAFSKSKEFLEDFIVLSLSMRCEGQHCERLLDIFASLKSNDNIISFNWDTIADATLEILQNHQYKNYLRIMTDDNILIRKYKNEGLFMKLHGSLNWIICQNKLCKDFNKPKLPLNEGIQKLPHLWSGPIGRCPSCQKKEPKRFIVPPVSNKLIEQNTFLHRLWLIAREKLPYAKRIIFVGYSFSPTDFYAEWLFRQIRFSTLEKPEIIIVNPEMFKKGSVVSKRYKTIFKDFKLIKYRTLADLAKEWRYKLSR